MESTIIEIETDCLDNRIPRCRLLYSNSKTDTVCFGRKKLFIYCYHFSPKIACIEIETTLRELQNNTSSNLNSNSYTAAIKLKYKGKIILISYTITIYWKIFISIFKYYIVFFPDQTIVKLNKLTEQLNQT